MNYLFISVLWVIQLVKWTFACLATSKYIYWNSSWWIQMIFLVYICIYEICLIDHIDLLQHFSGCDTGLRLVYIKHPNAFQMLLKFACTHWLNHTNTSTSYQNGMSKIRRPMYYNYINFHLTLFMTNLHWSLLLLPLLLPPPLGS